MVATPARPDMAQYYAGDWGGRTGGGGEGEAVGGGGAVGGSEEDRPPRYGQSLPVWGGGRRCPGREGSWWI